MDPRIVRTRRTVLDTATDLLVEGGPSALTMDAVVARSGVAKSTLYRHWATRNELVEDVFASCAPEIAPVDPDAPFEVAIRDTVRDVARALADDRWRRLFPALTLLARQQPELEAIDTDLKAKQHEIAESVFRRGVEEGALDPAVLDDPDQSIWLLIGPVLLASITGPLTQDEIVALADAAVGQFVRAHRPGVGA